MDIIKLIVENLIPILMIIIIFIAGFSISFLKNQFIKLNDADILDKIVEKIIKYVDQVAPALKLSNNDKFNMAKDKIVNIINEKGFQISDEEINILIESTVNTLRKK